MIQQHLKSIIFYLGIICLGLACTLDDESEVAQLVPEKYELLFSYGEAADLYQRRNLVDYFQMLTLATEFGPNIPLLKKWTKPMYIYVSGNPKPELITELQSIIAELNPLFTDGFEMQLVADSMASNFHIFLGDKSTYSKMYPATAPLLKENTGLFTYYINPDFSIASGHIFVETNHTQMRFQKHILREELTQSLGFPNDIQYYRNSVFYDQWSDVQTYSPLDIEVIRLMYHPQMIPRLSATSVGSILENILGI